MPERNPIEPGISPGRSLRCEEWESMASEAMEGRLTASDLASFEQHGQECAACAQMLEEMRQGFAWLGYLEAEPEAPEGLLAKILGANGAVAHLPAGIAAPSPTRSPGWHIAALPAARQAPFARQAMQPRRWMTAAMAFFSIALTLNVAGIKLSRLRLADLRPSAVSIAVTRQYYSLKEQGVKYYDNLRIVYELESQVRELRQSAEPAQDTRPQDSRRSMPRTSVPRTHSPSSRNNPDHLGGSRRKVESPAERSLA